MYLAKRVEQLELEKVSHDTMKERLRGKLDKKANNLFMHKLVNNMDAARNEINDKMGRYPGAASAKS